MMNRKVSLKKSIYFSASALFLYLILSGFVVHAALPWPGETWPEAEILTGLDADFQINLSGAHWNSETRTLWVCVNSGQFMALGENGLGSFQEEAEWRPGGDLEGITQVDLLEDSVYIMEEGTDLIKKFDTTTNGVIRLVRSWNIKPYVPTSGGSGSEGIAFVPDEWLQSNGFVDGAGNPRISRNGMGGLMFVAHQNGGGIYVFDLNPNNNTFTFVGAYKTLRAESSGLEFDRSSGKLFIWHNTGGNTFEVTNLTSFRRADGQRQFNALQEYIGPKTGNLEGFAMTPASSDENWAFFTDDDNQNGAALMWFKGFMPFPVRPDAYELFESTSLEVTDINSLRVNDAGILTDLILVSEPEHGILDGLAIGNAFDGTFVYTPDADFIGTDSFTYRADDGDPYSKVVKVNLTVKAVSSVDVRVSSSADDAEEGVSGSVVLNSTDLELVTDASVQTVGIRFAAVNVPDGAVITRAYIQFTTDEMPVQLTDLTIEGEASPHAQIFTTASRNISSRERTLAFVDWSPAIWELEGEAGIDQQTPDLTDIIQEMVTSEGWLSGNAMAFIITGTGKRVAESFDGVRNLAPLLHIEYEPIEGPQEITVVSNVISSANDAEESSTGTMSLTSTDLELVQDASAQKLGIRFEGLNIPANAEITSASIQFAVDETSSAATSLIIQGQAIGNAPVFTTLARNISSRVKTTSLVNWSPLAWNLIGEAADNQETPDLSYVIQEIVDRADWAPGNALAIVITGTGKRVAEAFDGDRALAPVLRVTYMSE